MSASIEHVPRAHMYFLNFEDTFTSEVRRIPYGIRTVAEEACNEYLRDGICAWVEETSDDIEYNNLVDEWMYGNNVAG